MEEVQRSITHALKDSGMNVLGKLKTVRYFHQWSLVMKVGIRYFMLIQTQEFQSSHNKATPRYTVTYPIQSVNLLLCSSIR